VSARRYRRLLPYALRQWPTLAAILILSFASSAVAALQPWPMKLLVDHALGTEPVPGALAALLGPLALSPTPVVLVGVAAAASLALFALDSLVDVGVSWGWTAAGQRMVFELAASLFHRLQRLSLRFHGQRAVGDSLTRLTGDTYCVYEITDAILISPAQHLFTLVAVGGIAWSLDPFLAGVSLLVAPLIAASAFYFGPRLAARARQDREAQSRVTSFVHRNLTAVPLVQAFGAEARNRRDFQALAADAVALTQRGNLLRSSYALLNGLAMTVGTALVLFLGGRRVLGGALSLGSLLVFLAYLRSLQGAFRGLLGTYATLKTSQASMDRVLELLDSEDAVREQPAARPLPARPAGVGAHVRLEAIRFGYEPGRPVLEDVTLEARPGETVALVGPTGAGKSTLVSLIPRFLDPWEGRVLLDGVDVREVQLPSLRAQIALVLQEPFLLPLSVAENIAYGRLGPVRREEIVAAAVAAKADEFIRKLPHGYDTPVGERGATLSGGQQQRLAIARALLKDAPVLVLDEPTSALDPRTEALLLEALERLRQDRTTFVIAHRLSTVRRADRIAVLERGRVVETGTHGELLGRGGAYARLHALQFADAPREEVA
jgi:ATP-binding cassette subfamily B protein/subfamily B ATP-binding cassette protein MsbA